MTPSTLKKIEENPAILMDYDTWAWAYYSEIRFVDGKYTIKGRGYQIEPLQSLSRRVCVSKATQGGWTMVYVLRSLHKTMKRIYPKGVLYLFPTQDTVTDFSASRFKTLITDNPEAIGRFIQDTNRDGLKRIGGGFLYFRGATLKPQKHGGIKQSAELMGIPADCIVFDEFNLMEPGVRKKALGRMEDSELKHEVYLGNPSIPDYGISRVYEEESDRRVYMITCRSCGKETCLELEFPNCLKRKADRSVYRACIHCGTEIYPDDGIWDPRSPDRSEYMYGYTNSHLVQPRTDLTEFLDAWENLSKAQNVSQATTDFYNLRLGQAYVPTENKLTPNDVYNICNMEAMRGSHSGPCAMGVDVRSASVFHVVIGFRPYESGVQAAKFARVSEINDVYDLAKKFKVSSCVMDRKPEIRMAKEFRDNADFEVFLCDYHPEQRNNPRFDSKEGLVTINRTEIFDATHHLVTEPGRYAIPRRDSEVEQYALEMSNAAKILKEDEETGSREYYYVKLGPDDYRHATNYFLLAAMRIGVCEREYDKHKVKDAYAFEDVEEVGVEIWRND